MYELPVKITLANSAEYAIRNNGDYRVILDVCEILADNELSETEKIIASIITFYTVFDSVDSVVYCADIEELCLKMLQFIEAGNNAGSHCKYKMIDWKQDETLLVSAINNVAKTEIRALPYLHWWTFIGYYMSIGECSLSTVVNLRDKLYKHKKLEKWEKEFIHNNPNYFSFVSEQNSSKEMLDKLWNKE